ncbi:MAG: triphosphoribosyl-dephospho-CoA synthase [Alphaproteobacteria bacterium]|nr:triphosphoribosyl-dephospho-CoA synthase [Alphaproteobacteria bacterium]
MTPHAVACAFVWACETELQALKPGNVHVHATNPRLSVAQFRRSARVAAPHIARGGSSVGRRILGAITATRAAVGTNTNLGIVLLAAPLCHAALAARGRPLRAALSATLAALTVGDARLAFRAIALAEPAGLGRRSAQDVRRPPTATLAEAMRLAAGRDRVARQYAATYADVLRTGVPALEQARAEGLSAPQATGRLYMTFLRRFSDSHLRRKFGPGAAAAVRREAKALPDTRAALLRFDRSLKRRGLNPGTTADLAVASLLAWRLVSIVGGEVTPARGKPWRKRSQLRARRPESPS